VSRRVPHSNRGGLAAVADLLAAVTLRPCDIQITIEDPKAYAKPWMITMRRHLLVDTNLLGFVCRENEKDLKHIVDK
jgi:hypothetical protein